MSRRIIHFCLTFLVLLSNLLLASWQAGNIALAASGQNALSLPGARPGGQFDLTGYVEVPYAKALNPSGGAITIEAWVKRNDASRCETLVGNGWHTSYWLGFCDGKLRFYPHGADSAVDSVAGIPAGTWTHIAVTYDGVTRLYYINGLLDSTSTAHPGPLTPAPEGQSLGIGVDLIDNLTDNYFSGLLDEVRIWNVVRSAAEIRASLFTPITTDATGLLAAWHFSGDAQDAAGVHNGAVRGNGASFVMDSAIPHEIRVPQVGATPTLDGQCDDYANATGVMAATYLMHTATDLWICLSDLNKPTAGHDNWVAVYLDIDHSRLDPAQPTTLSLQVDSDGTIRTSAGDGGGNYAATTVADGKWSGVYRICCGEFPTRSTEFRISAELLGGWSHIIGLALAQHWITGVGDDRLWPALAVYNKPSTWSSATLGGSGAPRTFSGHVMYKPPYSIAADAGIGGAGVNLIGSTTSGSEALVASATTDRKGNFSLISDDDYPLHRLELDTYTMPRGYLPWDATASAPALVVDRRTIDYRAAGAGSYPDNIFVLSDATPSPPYRANGPYFLIVAPQNVISAGALQNFVDFKQRLGFDIEVASIETIATSFSGADIGVKIRALELERRKIYGSRFKYVLLIGPDSVIPFRGLQIGATRATECLKSDPSRELPTDWYYADLTSNWDSNGNGCFGDGLWSNASTRAPGYTPDTGIVFQPAVALGRLPFASASAVRTALRNSIYFEQQADDWKHQTMLPMSMFSLKCRNWVPPNMLPTSGGHYVDCWGPPVNTDGSYLAELMQNDFLAPSGYTSTPFYENEHPATGSSPAHLISPKPASEANVVAELAAHRYGMVNLVGHGNGWGVYRTGWAVDANNNGMIEDPTEPLGSPPKSVYEVWQPPLLTNGGLSGLAPVHGSGAIFIAASCRTGYYSDVNSFGASLLSQGHGVAWIGGVANVIYGYGWQNLASGGAMTLDYRITRRLLDQNLRLGDAVWQSMSEQMNGGSNRDQTGIVFDLFGDPTLSYWGNAGGESTLAPWPMLRQNAAGTGATLLNGPGVPKRLWTYPATATGAATLLPSPVVSNRNEIIVAHGASVDVLQHGLLKQRLPLDAAPFGTPAIAADNTVYVVDVAGRLYAFAPNPSGFLDTSRSLRWKLDLGRAPLTSPVIGSDGFIAVARSQDDGSSLILLIRPDGSQFRAQASPQPAIGALAVDANRMVYAAGNSYLTRDDFFCATGTCVNDYNTFKPYNTPPLLDYGGAYIGNSDGVVEERSVTGALLASFHADSAISAGPVSGPGGQVLVGTQNGTLYSLSSDLVLRWQRAIGAPVRGVPAFSSDALYVASASKLLAYNPMSGVPLWQVALGAGTGDGSVAIGYGREVYVQTESGNVVAVGEGWAEPPVFLIAKSLVLPLDKLAIRVDWAAAPPPVGQSASTTQAVRLQATALGYRLQRRTDSSDWVDLAMLPSNTTSFTDTLVATGTNYAYRIQALDAAGNDSDFTATLASVRSLPTHPLAPTLQSVTALAADRLRLTWSAPQDTEVTSYRIERSNGPNDPFAKVTLTTGETLSFDDAELLPGASYSYRVLAINEAGESTPSVVQSATTYQRSLPAPQNLTVKLLENGQVQISWAGGPVGATAVVEVNPLGLAGYFPLDTTSVTGPYTYAPGLPNSYSYRVKFVQDKTESDYTVETTRITISGIVDTQAFRVLLPLVKR